MFRFLIPRGCGANEFRQNASQPINRSLRRLICAAPVNDDSDLVMATQFLDYADFFISPQNSMTFPRLRGAPFNYVRKFVGT